MAIFRFNNIGERILVSKNGNIRNIMAVNEDHEYLPRMILHDQEPIFYHGQKKNWLRLWNSRNRLDARSIILTSEENSTELEEFCEFTGAIPCHWFSNGALALEWYDPDKMSLDNNNINNRLFYKFSCLNRLISNQRIYRPIISSFLLKTVRHDWLQLSCNIVDPDTHEHACKTDAKIPSHHRALLNTFVEKEKPILLNTSVKENMQGSIENQSFNISSYYFDKTFCHIVTETLFYGKTLHLTEKSLRPIANRRPFVMVGPPGSLGYLKRYGFKTFDGFWNEDYDNIDDPHDRLDAVMEVIKNINDWSLTKMQSVLVEMKDVLEYNYDHFYGNFWKIIKQELVDNLQSCCNALSKEFKPGLTYKSIESMSPEEYETYMIKKEFGNDELTLLDIMKNADSSKLKSRAALLCNQLIHSYYPHIKAEAGKEELLANLRRIMNK